MNDPIKEQWIKLLNERQHNEADLHWKRNGFFLLSSSILLIALGQFHIPAIGLAFAILGLMLNSVWLLIQYRSSEYIKWYKAKVKELEKGLTSPPEIYPDNLGGIQMRKLAMLLPLPFLMIWGWVLAQALIELIKI